MAQTRRRDRSGDSFRFDEHDLEARVVGVLNRRAAVGLAVGVVSDGRLMFFSGHGLADVASGTPITEDTVFRIGSITKTFTAVAVMQLWEQGLLDLDAPADDYLRAFRLIPTRSGFGPATVRHLLTHTAGVPEVRHPWDVARQLFGETVRPGRPVPSLAEYYKDGLPIVVEPGTRFIYTDHGFTALGQIVEDLTGTRLDQYMREHIFTPLGMEDTDLARSDRFRSRLATGYTLGRTGAEAVSDYEVVTIGGGGAYSTVADMARYTAALLGGGANARGSMLKPETLVLMFEPHFQPDSQVPGIGLAFDRGDAGGHRLIEHGGILPGFDSHLVVAPDDGVGVLAFTNGARRAMFWLPSEMTDLIGYLLGVPDQRGGTDMPQRPELWADMCGRYRLEARLTDIRARMAAGAGVEVFVKSDRLMLRALLPIPVAYRGFPLEPDDPHDPYVFRMDLSGLGMGGLRVAFSHEPDGQVTAVHIAEGKPLSARKRSAPTHPRLWVTGAIGMMAVAASARAARRRSRRDEGGRSDRLDRHLGTST